MTNEIFYVTATGTGDAIVGSLTRTPLRKKLYYTTGVTVSLKMPGTNTGAVTININGLGAKDVKKFVGGALAALVADDLTTDEIIVLVYNGTSFQLVAKSPNTLVDANGKVGIGTSSPASLTEIRGGLTTTGAVLTLGSKEPSTVANDILGRVNFYAPLDSAGTDANLVAGSIVARAEGTFSASSNATSLLLQTGSSETATTKVVVKSGGNVLIGTETDDGASKLQVSGKATVYDLTAVSGVSTLAVRAGAGQANDAIFNVLANNGTTSVLRVEATKVGFFNVSPVTRPTALTTADANTINTGDATSDTVIGNMRTRIGELESKLQALGLLT